jgi:hypothetical protein
MAGVVMNPQTSFDGTFYLQDNVGAWNGIYVYSPGADFDEGDSILITGEVDEYYGLTELVSIDYDTILTAGVDISSWAETVTPSALTDPDTTEMFEGVLVSMDSVEVFTIRDAYGEFWIGTGTDSFQVGDFAPYTHEPGIGSIIDITGHIWMRYGWKMEPRYDADIVVVDSCEAGKPWSRRPQLLLYQNSPNPFIRGTLIRYAVPRKMRVRLAVHDVRGRLVQVLTDKEAEPGEHTLMWDGKDSNGQLVGPGIYFNRLTTPERVITKKIVHIR